MAPVLRGGGGVSQDEKLAAFFRLMEAHFDETLKRCDLPKQGYTEYKYWMGRQEALVEMFEAAEALGLHANYSKMPV